jgi:ABC-2 type transport system ATP-binding protein
LALDPGQVVEVRELIREIGKERTVLLSTHLLNEAQNICDRVLIINKGKIVAEDTTENLQARLLGAERVVCVCAVKPMNLLKPSRALKGVRKVETLEDGGCGIRICLRQRPAPRSCQTDHQRGYDLLEFVRSA